MSGRTRRIGPLGFSKAAAAPVKSKGSRSKYDDDEDESSELSASTNATSGSSSASESSATEASSVISSSESGADLSDAKKGPWYKRKHRPKGKGKGKHCPETSERSSHHRHRSDSSSSSSGHRKHRRHRRQRVVLAYDKKPAAAAAPASSAKKESSSSNEKVMIVQAVKEFEQEIPWVDTEMIITLEGSLRDLAGAARPDNTVLLTAGRGVIILKTSPSIFERMTSNAKKMSQAEVEADPFALLTNEHLTHEAIVVQSHNGFPCRLSLEMPNIQASSRDTVFPSVLAKNKQSLSLILERGESLSKHRVFKNTFERGDLDFFSSYQHHTPDNLREGTLPATSRNGVERLMVPSSAENPHPVVDLAQLKFTEEMSKKELIKYKRKDNKYDIPADIMCESLDDPGYVIMSKPLFNKYAERCQTGMKSRHALSDVAHPIVFVSRVVHNDHFTRGQVATRSRMDGGSGASASSQTTAPDWLHKSEIEVGRVDQKARDNALSTTHSAFVRLLIRSRETSGIVDDQAK